MKSSRPVEPISARDLALVGDARDLDHDAVLPCVWTIGSATPYWLMRFSMIVRILARALGVDRRRRRLATRGTRHADRPAGRGPRRVSIGAGGSLNGRSIGRKSIASAARPTTMMRMGRVRRRIRPGMVASDGERGQGRCDAPSGVERGVDSSRRATRLMPGTEAISSMRRRAHLLRRAEDAQAAPAFVPVRPRARRRAPTSSGLGAQLAVVRDRKAVRLVAQPLERGRAPASWPAGRAVVDRSGQEDLLALLGEADRPACRAGRAHPARRARR